jgi:hypothetical protein
MNMASTPTRAHLDPERVRRCVSQKVGYYNYAEALNAAELMMLKGICLEGCHITPYACELCNEWHVYNRVIVRVLHPKGVAH